MLMYPSGKFKNISPNSSSRVRNNTGCSKSEWLECSQVSTARRAVRIEMSDEDH